MPSAMLQSSEEQQPAARGRAAGRARSLVLAAMLALLAVAAAEGVAWVALWLMPNPADPHIRADSYPPEAPWVGELYRELKLSARLRWEPYVYWRRLPFAGQFVNVDGRGLRRTWQPPARSGGDPGPRPSSGATAGPPGGRRPRIFVLGGSDVWGTGVRDDHTLPSELARWLAAAGVEAEVVNYGETGYVSTQSVISLLRELQRGNVPDVVVLYVGVNDAFSAFQSGAAGQPQNETHRVAEFNLLRHTRRLMGETLRAVAARSALVRLTRRLRGPAPASAAPIQAEAGDGLDRTETRGTISPRLAGEVVHTLDVNAGAVQALCAVHGCRAIACWAPDLLDKLHRTPYEESRAALISAYAGAILQVEDAVRRDWAGHASAADRLFLGGLFAATAAPRFIEAGHTSETANAEIAAAIGRHLLDHRLLPPPGPDTSPVE